MKNNLIIDVEDRLVQYLSDTYAGRVHDKRICDEENYTFPPCGLFQDTGFQGYKPGADFSRGRAGIAAKTRYAFGILSQGFQRRPLPDAMPSRQHTR